jgi:DNA repair protein RadA/Sms
LAKSAVTYVCQECGATHPKWAGRCDACGAWNTLAEEAPLDSAPKGLGSKRGKKIEFVHLDGPFQPPPRRVTGIAEFDRVCGGGLVPGSALLIGGDPGIGKSTLVLQITAALSGSVDCVYISGEEAIDQIRMRSERLGARNSAVNVAAATSVRDIVSSLESGPTPGLVIIDSIQTLWVDSLDSAPGTVAQVRTSAQELIRLAKRRGFALILIGHVTKEGVIAGPRVLEHMVDTVLYFEGERGHQFRILRAVKNRFGPTDEIGVFEMTDGGLREVSNPSSLFLADHDQDISGACVFAGVEGTRPILVEIQALIAPSALGTPRRAVVGWDSGRLAMIMAVLEARCGLALAGNDVYLNVAGGMRVTEPAADLAVAAALVSAANRVPLPLACVVFGEISLSGEVRTVSRTDARLKEAAKLGFKRVILPKNRRGGGSAASGLTAREIGHVQDLVQLVEAEAPRKQRQHG